MKARFIASRELAPNTRHFDFESIDWDTDFVPGQFLSLTANEITRAYSIASPPGTKIFSLCANLVPDGRFSPWLFALQPGDEIEFKGPYGAFIPRRPMSDSIFVATGTGIAPFRAMLLAATSTTQIDLIFGVRHQEGLLYHDEFRQLPNLRYHPTLTRPSLDWPGLTGRVQPHVLRTLGDRRDVDIYICGLKEMVDDLRTQLKAIGLDRKRIIYEKYD